MRHRKRRKINLKKKHTKKRFLNLFNSLITKRKIITNYKNIIYYKPYIFKKNNLLGIYKKIVYKKIGFRNGDNSKMGIIKII